MAVDLTKRELNVSQEKKLDIVACLKVLAEHLDTNDEWTYARKVFATESSVVIENVFAVELAKFRKIQRLRRTFDRTPDLPEAL